jgi:DNA-binding NarL/FixJ family response regulator
MNATETDDPTLTVLPLPSAKARVMVVEDHPLVREGLIRLLNRQPDLSCCGHADSVASARVAIGDLSPDLVLMDLTLKDGNGLELLDEVTRRHPGLRVLVLSQHDEDTHAELVLRHGARGYVMKQEATQEVIAAARKVLGGGYHLSQRMAARLHHRFPDVSTGPGSTSDKLTDREQQVLQLLGGGLNTREVAAELDLSVKTIETYREHLKTKLGLANAQELTQYAAQSVRRQPRS